MYLWIRLRCLDTSVFSIIVLLVLCLVEMELLGQYKVRSELSKSEFVLCLCRFNDAEQISELRQALFEETINLGLADDGDCLVRQR